MKHCYILFGQLWVWGDFNFGLVCAALGSDTNECYMVVSAIYFIQVFSGPDAPSYSGPSTYQG
jgi:hypothetical protein